MRYASRSVSAAGSANKSSRPSYSATTWRNWNSMEGSGSSALGNGRELESHLWKNNPEICLWLHKGYNSNKVFTPFIHITSSTGTVL